MDEENKKNINEKKSSNLVRVLGNISRYSSGDNSQPFCFVANVFEQKIDIYHNSEIAKHELNSNNLTSVITYGMIIQMIEELSLAFNFSYNIKKNFLVNGLFLDKEECWAEVSFDQFSKDVTNNFFDGVVTNRLHYKKEEIRFSKMKESIYVINKIKGNLLTEVLKADSLLWSNRNVFIDIFSWLHLSKKKYSKMNTGFHYSEANLSFFEAVLLVMLKNKYIFSLVPKCLVKRIHQMKTRRLLNQTPHYICFTNKIESFEDLISLGKDAFHVKYILSKEGIATQPLSILTLPYLFEKKFNSKGHFEYNFKKLQKELREELKDTFKNESNINDVVWIFRAGRPEVFLPLSLKKMHKVLTEKTSN